MNQNYTLHLKPLTKKTISIELIKNISLEKNKHFSQFFWFLKKFFYFFFTSTEYAFRATLAKITKRPPFIKFVVSKSMIMIGF